MTKAGFNYYTVDCDRYQDRKIKRLKKGFGCSGIAVYDYILCEIYRVQGCFLEWDENTVFDVAEYFGLKEDAVLEIVKYCGFVGLFDKDLLSRGIITSVSIQHRYMEMCYRAKRKDAVIPDILIIRDNNKYPEEAVAPACVYEKEPNGMESGNKPCPLTLEQEVEALKKDDYWLDQLQVLHSMDVRKLRAYMDDFKAQCVADGKDNHRSLQDAKSHFNSWLRIVVTRKNRNDDNNKPKRRTQCRANFLEPDAEKTYGEAF
jgi:hypothetical protein